MLFSNSGAAPRRVIPAQAHPARDAAQAVWLDLLSPTEEERDLAERATGLRIPSMAELAEIESSSRTYTVGDTLFLSAPMSYRSEDGTSHVAPLGFVLSPERLITVRFARAPAFDTFAELFARGEARHPASGICSASVFVGLLEAIVDRLADVLEHVGRDLDEVSRRVFQPNVSRRPERANRELRATLSQVGRFGDGLSNLRDSLLGVSRIVNFAPGAARDWLPSDLQPRFDTLHHDLVSLTDYDAQLTNKVQLLLDATLGFISIEQNNNFRVLTIISVVGIPPTLVASVYGMNFEHIPELHWAYGYYYGLAVIALSALIPLAWFRWRGWF